MLEAITKRSPMCVRNKFLVSALVTLSLCAASNAQSGGSAQTQKPAQPETKLEEFLGERGRLVVKDFYQLGRISSLGSAQMDALVISEPGSSQKTKGLRIEVTESGSLERSNISFIDFDELKSLSEALSYISNLAAKWDGQQNEPYTEVTYVSKGEFEVGFFQTGKKTSAFIRSGLIGPATAYLKISDVDRLKAMVDQASTLLNSK